jgi:hypothetical protein
LKFLAVGGPIRARHSDGMKKSLKSKPGKKKTTQKPKPDASQIALAAVEQAVGGKLAAEH